MKNLVKSVLVVMTVGMFATSASAMDFVPVQDTVVTDTVKQDPAKQDMLLAQNEVTYTKIEADKVAEAVKTAVAAKYEGYVIDEAFEGSDKSCKLVLKKEDAKVTVIYNEAGEFVKEEGAEAGQGVGLV